MKYISTAIIILFSSCSSSFINHQLKAERIGDCTPEQTAVKMNSNINGERYEFNYCLQDGYTGKDYKVERKGDSLIVSFPAATAKKAMYKLTLDIDAKPAYHHIILGDKELEIVPAER
jgi:hypothetical protein